MVKLFACHVSHNPYKETDIIEIPENIFQVDGYDIRSRLLEGVMFNVTFDPSTEKVTHVEVDEEYEDYFSDFNAPEIYGDVEHYANQILKTGDEVDVPQSIRTKYKIGENKLRNVSYIKKM